MGKGNVKTGGNGGNTGGSGPKKSTTFLFKIRRFFMIIW